MIFAKDENVGERQYTLIGHYINCTDLQITTDYISLVPVIRVPRIRCPLAGVWSLADNVCPQGGEPMLGGEVSRLPLVTSGAHTSQTGGEVSSNYRVWRRRGANDTCHV